MSQRGTSCANLYAAAVQHDKLYNASHCKSKKCAFTLAEVLITLVIIGVVAALTIPNLMQKYQEQTTVKKVQKFYSNLSNAYSLAMKDNGDINEWGVNEYTQESAIIVYEKLFKPYFKIGKNCGTENTGNCVIKTEYKRLDNNEHVRFASNKYYKVALDDGAVVFWRSTTESENDDIVIFYDINGIKEPNQWGKDTFEFLVISDKVIPSGIQYKNAFNSCKLTNSGFGCAAWVIYKGNMDYLHCDGLTWDSHSCKDK